MHALLSFEQAPPLAAPFRFFLTAPPFAMLAGVLMLWTGPDLFASRWTPPALALTHLITVGFLLQVMLGAMIQILPVVAGANMVRPGRIASLVHGAIVPGALLLTTGFLTFRPLAFWLAAILLGSGTLLFVGAAGHALFVVPSTNPTIRGLKLSLPGLTVTVGLGSSLAAGLAGSLQLPLQQLTTIHLAWGLFGWGVILLASVAFVVVPMFQITPPYPAWFARSFAWSVLTLLCCWTLAAVWQWSAGALLAGATVLQVLAFAALTLHVQRRSKRASFDTTQILWRVAMLCTVAACILCYAGLAVPALDNRLEWLCGILALVGGFMSVTIGMLYKIVPFLVWLHLQNLGGGRVLAPSMHKVIAARQIERQAQSHFLSLALLLTAVFWPEWLAFPAGLAIVLANAWLLRNLLAAGAFYRRHRLQIAAVASVGGTRM